MPSRMRMLCAAALLLAGCVPVVADGEAPPVNPLAYARRPPPPGHPGYLQAIKFIDDGLQYIDGSSQFFISPVGELCFRVRPNYPETIYAAPYRNWCIYPQQVDRVEAGTNDITGINEVRLWCVRAAPQCVRNPERGWVSNSISAATVSYLRERAALEDLIYMMGGNVRPTETVSANPPDPGELGRPRVR